MVDGLVQLHLSNYRKSGTELILGEGKLVGPKMLEVHLNEGGTRHLTGERLFLSLGTHAAIPDTPALAAAKPMTHIEVLELDHTPRHLMVVGGGHVGLELGQAMKRLGSQVTVIERGEQLLSREDSDVSDALLELFRDEGIIDQKGRERIIDGSDLLVATGRTPNTRGIGLEEAGIKLNAREDRDNLNGGARTTRDRLIPSCLFTDPELARVGLNELQAKERGIEYRAARMPMEAVLRARTLSETRGFLKMLIDEHSNSILGFTGFGAEASELMAVVQTAIVNHAPFQSLRDTIFTHPTMAEGLTGLLTGVAVRPSS